MEEQISNLQKLQNAIGIIKECALGILTENAEKNATQTGVLSELLAIIFPIVIEDYSLPVFANRQEEITLWVDLLGQITQLIAGDDCLAKYDILCEVLIPDLQEHIQVLQEQK